MAIEDALKALQAFQGDSLTRRLAAIEGRIRGYGKIEIDSLCAGCGIDATFMDSALAIKRVAGQINVIIHAAGILQSLKTLLEPGEIVESLSLGAGNTGRQFDLETNRRVAEYKFIDWQGGPESIRQNSIFKDFFELAEFQTHKKKYLYVIGLEFPLKFFNGGRALTSVLSRNPKIHAKIKEKYGDEVTKVCDYYAIKKEDVAIYDISPHIGRSE
ncbi:MAG: hypothetical protein AB7E73_03375 [Burkholderiales bacterium]